MTLLSMRVSVVTVTWNSIETIEAQMRSLVQAAVSVSYEQIIVDNASSDTTIQTITNTHLPCKVITLNKNKGFAAANNEALQYAQGQYVLFLNPDMELLPGALDALVTAAEAHQNAAIVSGHLVNTNGIMDAHLRPRPFPRRRDMLIMLLKARQLFPHTVAEYTNATFDETKEQVVDTVRGACMLVRRSFIDEIGFAFDPRYFIWFEDVDICREAKKRGLTVHYTPYAKVIDHVGQSFKKQKLFWKQKQFTKSMMQYAWKWGHPLFAVGIFLVRLPLLALVWVADTIGLRFYSRGV